MAGNEKMHPRVTNGFNSLEEKRAVLLLYLEHLNKYPVERVKKHLIGSNLIV